MVQSHIRDGDRNSVLIVLGEGFGCKSYWAEVLINARGGGDGICCNVCIGREFVVMSVLEFRLQPASKASFVAFCKENVE